MIHSFFCYNKISIFLQNYQQLKEDLVSPEIYFYKASMTDSFSMFKCTIDIIA